MDAISAVYLGIGPDKRIRVEVYTRFVVGKSTSYRFRVYDLDRIVESGRSHVLLDDCEIRVASNMGNREIKRARGTDTKPPAAVLCAYPGYQWEKLG